MRATAASPRWLAVLMLVAMTAYVVATETDDADPQNTTTGLPEWPGIAERNATNESGTTNASAADESRNSDDDIPKEPPLRATLFLSIVGGVGVAVTITAALWFRAEGRAIDEFCERVEQDLPVRKPRRPTASDDKAPTNAKSTSAADKNPADTKGAPADAAVATSQDPAKTADGNTDTAAPTPPQPAPQHRHSHHHHQHQHHAPQPMLQLQQPGDRHHDQFQPPPTITGGQPHFQYLPPQHYGHGSGAPLYQHQYQYTSNAADANFLAPEPLPISLVISPAAAAAGASGHDGDDGAS